MLKGYTEDTLCLPTDDKEAHHFLQSISTLMKKHGEKLTHLDKIPSPEGGTTTGKISDIEHCYTVLIHPLKDFIRPLRAMERRSRGRVDRDSQRCF
jgi:hypothetical protein